MAFRGSGVRLLSLYLVPVTSVCLRDVSILECVGESAHDPSEALPRRQMPRPLGKPHRHNPEILADEFELMFA